MSTRVTHTHTLIGVIGLIYVTVTDIIIFNAPPVGVSVATTVNVQIASHHCSINSHSLTIFTTGCPTSSTTIPTALYFTINSHPCLTLAPVLFRDPPSDLPTMPLQEEISQPLFLEILYVNLLTILI